MSRAAAVTPDQFATFGDLLKYLRRRAGLTQRELSIAVGYSDTQISRLEQNQRVPDATTLTALFVPALQIESEPVWVKHLLALAVLARRTIEVPDRVAPAGAPSLLDRIVRGQLIGRQSELKELQGLWRRAREGQGHLALIAGEPGIGKTRLARELQEHARATGAAVLAGGCYEFEAVAPYLPFVEAWRAWSDAQSAAALRDKLGAAAPELARLVPALEVRLGPLTPNPPLSPNEERLRLFDHLARFVQALAAPNGLLIFLDDLHWADQGTLALLHYLLRRLREVCVLFLATYRDADLDRAHPLAAALVEWNRERLATRIALGRLSLAETGAMLAALFGEVTVSQEFSEAIHRETEGNPFFIEEVVKSLIEQGDVYQREAGWDRRAISDLTIPQSIKEAIGRRLNRLSAGCLDVLHTAAGLGKAFPFGELASVVNMDEDQLLDALDEAGQAQLVRPEGGESFAFTHDKIREVLYEELNPIRRRRLHQRIGEGLERLYAAPAARTRHVPDLAHHFIQSRDLHKGLAYSLEAAAQARAVFALDEALGHYQRAADCADALSLNDQLAEIQAEAGAVHGQHGYFPRAAEHYQRALDLLAPDDRPRRAVLCMKIGSAYAQVGDARGPGYLQQAELALDANSQPAELAATLAMLGRYHHYYSQHHTAITFYERARELAEPLGQPQLLHSIYIYLAGAYQHLTEYASSRAWAGRAIALGETHNLPPAVADGYEYLAEDALGQGHWQAVLDYAARDREIAEKIGALNHTAWADLCCAWARHGLGELAAAQTTGRAALALAEQIGDERLAVLVSAVLRLVETDLGLETTDAEAWLKRADALGQIFLRGIVRHSLAYSHLHHGRGDVAAALYAECDAFYRPTDNRVTRLHAGPYPALAHLALGQSEVAARSVEDYLVLARAAEAPHHIGCALGVQGQILAAQGRPAEAEAALDKAAELLEPLGSRLELGRIFYQRGLLKRSLSKPETAQADLEQALALFEACGAARDRERAAGQLQTA